jgi:hypothetical protein
MLPVLVVFSIAILLFLLPTFVIAKQKEHQAEVST